MKVCVLGFAVKTCALHCIDRAPQEGLWCLSSLSPSEADGSSVSSQDQVPPSSGLPTAQSL